MKKMLSKLHVFALCGLLAALFTGTACGETGASGSDPTGSQQTATDESSGGDSFSTDNSSDSQISDQSSGSEEQPSEYVFPNEGDTYLSGNDGYTIDHILVANYFDESVDDLEKDWWKTSWYGPSETSINEHEQLVLKSSQHLFCFGHTTWGAYGCACLQSGYTYLMSFDIKPGEPAKNAEQTKIFDLYLKFGGEDPRFGETKALVTLDFDSTDNLRYFAPVNTVMNSDLEFANVTFDEETGFAHIDAFYTVPEGADSKTNSYRFYSGAGGSSANYGWILDNLLIAEVSEVTK